MKTLFDNIKSNALEYWTLLMIVIGLPLATLFIFGWAIAFAVFVVVNVTLGLFATRIAK